MEALHNILDQIHRPSLKLAALYLAVIMSISLFLSTIIYQTSVAELRQGARRPIPQFELRAGQLLPNNFREALLAERAAQIAEAEEAIRDKLLMLNIMIMLGSGMLSYVLAARTLRPIEAAHEALERFTADASHELRTPITVMQTETEVALLDPKLNLATAKAQLRSNVTELGRLTDLTAGLLRLARSGIEPKAFESISAHELVSEAVSLIERRAKAKNITVSVQKLPQIFIQGDKPALIDTLVILLDNAVKYSPRSSTVTISSNQEQNRLLIRVADNGIGIKKSDLPHVFERFYRADSSRTNDTATSGYGLGLAIAENIVMMHGGDIQVQSKVGKGSTFTISLPTIANPKAPESTSQE